MAIVNIAKKYHYPYKVLLTPDGDLNSAERLIKRYSVSKSYLIKHHSLELYFHAPIKQYPLIFDIQKNTLQERVIIGPKTYDEYEEIFYFNPNDIQKNDINGRSRT